MKIGFFSEAAYLGKVPRDIPMRTDQAWVCALNANHHCVFELDKIGDVEYDVGVCIILVQC